MPAGTTAASVSGGSSAGTARGLVLSLALAGLLWLGATAPHAPPPPLESPAGGTPLFDAHMHYSVDAWEQYDVDAIVALLDRAGVRVALISSTPDDGTLRLHARAPDRVVPMLRPYRTRADMADWTRDEAVAAYLRERIGAPGAGVTYRGIGEFHLYPGEAERPTVAEAARLARAHGLVLHAHADERAIEELLRVYPGVRVLWAHAGMSASPEAVGRIVDAHRDRLWVELALRYDVASSDGVDDAWAALFARHPDRFMVGTDTWIPAQWTRLVELKEREQRWLARLSPDLRERLAWRNAACLFADESTAIRRPSGCPPESERRR